MGSKASSVVDGATDDSLLRIFVWDKYRPLALRLLMVEPNLIVTYLSFFMKLVSSLLRLL